MCSSDLPPIHPTVSHLVFVYGTLKQGFRNFHVNHGRRIGDAWVTVEPHALWICGEWWLPWLRPGAGVDGAQPVQGELYEVDDAGFAAMDRLEQIDEAGWYERVRIAVRPVDPPRAAATEAWVYYGSAEGLSAGGVRGGPLACFTLQDQDLLPRERWHEG